MRDSLRYALIEPVRRGPLNLRSRDAQTAGVILASAITFAVIMVAILAADQLRPMSEIIAVPSESGAIIIPSTLIPIVLTLIGFATAVVMTGALRCHAMLCTPLVAIALFMLAVIVASSGNAQANASPPLLGYLLIASAGAAAVVIRRFPGGSARDLILLTLLVEGAMAVAQAGFTATAANAGVRLDIVTIALMLAFLTALALPVTFASGIGAVDAGIGITLGLVAGVTDSVPRAWAWLATAALAIAQIWLVFSTEWNSERLTSLISAIVVGAVALVIVTVTRLRSTDPDDVRMIISRVGLPVGAGLSTTAIAGSILGLLGIASELAARVSLNAWLVPPRDWLLVYPGPDLGRWLTITGVVLVGVAVRRARPIISAGCLLTGLLLAAYSLDSAGLPWWRWTPSSIADISFAVVLVAVLVRAARRASALPIPLVATLVALTLLLRQPDALATPLTLVVGGSMIAVIIVGLVWGLLTDSAAQSTPTRWLQRDGRLLLAVGNYLFGATLLAWAVLGSQPRLSTDLEAASGLGVRTLGTALILILIATLLSRLMSRARVENPSHGETGSDDEEVS